MIRVTTKYGGLSVKTTTDTSKPVNHLWREDGREELICKHGIGHTTYKSAVKVADKYKEWEGDWGKENGMTREDGIATWMVHGCDGCCKNWKECRK